MALIRNHKGWTETTFAAKFHYLLWPWPLKTFFKYIVYQNAGANQQGQQQEQPDLPLAMGQTTRPEGQPQPNHQQRHQ
ncbi:hypothetical protein Q4563_19380, partial [Gilvimarinus sp. 1_MG-2023]